MRKYGFLVLVFALIFSGCQWWLRYDSTISNESSHAVIFRVQNTDTATLQPGETITVRNYIGARLDYYESDPARRVGFVQTGYRTGKFIDLLSIPVIIYNTLSISVTLQANGYLGVEPMVIPANNNNSVSVIYTTSPAFTVSTESFPATADFQIVDGTMFVTVR